MNQTLLPFLVVMGIAALFTVTLSILVTAARPFARRRTVVGPGTAIFCYIAAAIQLALLFAAQWICGSHIS